MLDTYSDHGGIPGGSWTGLTLAIHQFVAHPKRGQRLAVS
jgi:hypothetical protein